MGYWAITRIAALVMSFAIASIKGLIRVNNELQMLES